MEYQISIRDTPGNKPDKSHFSHGENIMEGELESEGHSSFLFALAVSKVPIYSNSLVCLPKPLLSKVQPSSSPVQRPREVNHLIS